MNRTVPKSVILSVMLLVLPSFANAAPTISSANRVGSELTISGTALGAHPDYSSSQPFLNLAFNDFETGEMSSGGLSKEGPYSENWRIQTNDNRPNSTIYAENCYNPEVNYRGGALGLTQPADYSVWYTSFYMKTPGNVQASKFLRIYGSDPQFSEDPYLYLATGSDTNVNNTKIRGRFGPTGSVVWGSPNSFGDNTWHRVETYMNNVSGVVTVWMDGKHQWTRTDWPIEPTFKGHGHSWAIGTMIEPDGPVYSGTYGFDDVYFSPTQARVEIGNASTWEACTVREIQIPKTWSSSAVTVQARNGAFKTGDPAYLYVIDANGAISNALPVTIGAGSGTTDPTPPTAPTGLRVQ